MLKPSLIWNKDCFYCIHWRKIYITSENTQGIWNELRFLLMDISLKKSEIEY